MGTRAVLGWVLAGLVIAGAVAVAWISWLPGSGASAALGPAMIASAWAVTGALLVTARPGNSVGWLVLASGVLQAWSDFGYAYGGYGVGVADPSWPAADWVALSSSMIYLPSLLLPITVILAVYPNGRLPSRRWRAPVAAVGIGLTVVTVISSLSPGAYDDIAPGPPPVQLPAALWVSLLAGTGAVLLLGGMLAVWVIAGFRLARAQPPQRAQLAWYAATVVPSFLFLFYAPLPPWLTQLGGLSIPLAIGVGVLRYRMLDIVLRPWIVYGALTIAVVAVFVGVSALAGTALERGPLPAVTAAALVAVGLTPARERVQRTADRFVYGERRDPMRAVATLADQVESADQESLLRVVVTSVAAAVRAPGACVTGRSGQLLAAHGDVPETSLTLPLVVAGDPVGTLLVAPRAAGANYSPADGRVLGALAPQVAVVVHALDLAGALQAQRDRVVTATRSERERLRHELHDGLGPALSGTALGLQAACDALARGDTTTVGRILQRMRTEVDLAVVDIRRVIDDLRPADLDDGGLEAAVRRRAASVAAVLDVDVAVGALPDLPPDTETAAYRIAGEALTNVARHAGARQVRVAVGASDDTLTLRVSDDGSGIPDGAGTGVGLESMRRRAEALGGTLQLDTSQDGTVVTARIPL